MNKKTIRDLLRNAVSGVQLANVVLYRCDDKATEEKWSDERRFWRERVYECASDLVKEESNND